MKKFLDGVWEFCVKFLDAFFLGFILPGIIFAVVWYFVTGEFIFNKKERKAPPDSQPVETQPLPIEAAEVETESPPEVRDTENLSLPEVDPLPAQVAATEEESFSSTELQPARPERKPAERESVVTIGGIAFDTSKMTADPQGNWKTFKNQILDQMPPEYRAADERIAEEVEDVLAGFDETDQEIFDFVYQQTFKRITGGQVAEKLPAAEQMALSAAATNIAALRMKYTKMQIENERKMEAIQAELDARRAKSEAQEKIIID